MIKLIYNHVSVKEIIQLHCEGTNNLCKTKLRLMPPKFERLKMKKKCKTIVDYNTHACDIANEAQTFGGSF